jgi:WhiB family redox-sensing transcriptional regulator
VPRRDRTPELQALIDATPLGDNTDWMADGQCAQTDPEAFFPHKGGTTRPAKTVCDGCPVLGECLTYAVAHDERFGVWGGASERERRPLHVAVRDQSATESDTESDTVPRPGRAA